jgi:peroxiredoxin
MNMIIKHVFPIVILLAGFAPNVGLGGLIGDPAQPLLVKKWIQGQPVEVEPGTNIYVVEVWRTTSSTCRASITNLNDIQRRFKTNGVIVVGISDEPAEKIAEFIQQSETKIEYAIAADDKRQTSLSYMKPVGQRTVPYAFVVGTNGYLLWHGTPQHGLDKVLDEIIAGQYDMGRAKKVDRAYHQMDQYLNLARQGDQQTQPVGRALLAARTNDVTLLCDLACTIATVPRLANRDFVLANEALDQAEKLSINSPTNITEVRIARAIVLFESGKRDEGLALATQTLASAQSPIEKTNIQSLIRTLEKRKNGEEKTGGPALVNTNAPLEQGPASSHTVTRPNP